MALASDEVLAAFPSGVILSWYNKAGKVPRGWALCDGKTPGVPDLTGRFLRGVADPAAVGQPGGAETHTHKVAKDGGRDGRGFEVNGTCGLGDADNRNHLPPYDTVLFIMKL
ncbi:MAG: tail fiber protein [Betaproteobacteria bacterium]|nr:tail fiber protein [Betaproteobacteria bacterium]